MVTRQEFEEVLASRQYDTLIEVEVSYINPHDDQKYLICELDSIHWDRAAYIVIKYAFAAWSYLGVKQKKPRLCKA